MTKVFLSVLVLAALQVSAQTIYISTSSKISFFAGTPIEDIDAVNLKAISFLNINTGEVTISIPNKEFQFKRSLMEEHFNENYMESEKFPKSDFKGKLNDIQKIGLKSKGSFAVTVTGILTVHGISKERTIDITIHTSDGKIEGETKFIIPLADHNIERPKILWEKMAENVEVTANFIYEPYKK
jgi:hypothetical protein